MPVGAQTAPSVTAAASCQFDLGVIPHSSSSGQRTMRDAIGLCRQCVCLLVLPLKAALYLTVVPKCDHLA